MFQFYCINCCYYFFPNCTDHKSNLLIALIFTVIYAQEIMYKSQVLSYTLFLKLYVILKCTDVLNLCKIFHVLCYKKTIFVRYNNV